MSTTATSIIPSHWQSVHSGDRVILDTNPASAHVMGCTVNTNHVHFDVECKVNVPNMTVTDPVLNFTVNQPHITNATIGIPGNVFESVKLPNLKAQHSEGQGILVSYTHPDIEFTWDMGDATHGKFGVVQMVSVKRDAVAVVGQDRKEQHHKYDSMGRYVLENSKSMLNNSGLSTY